ncbi:phage head closure protein [Sulfuriferula sp.]|uniref:phage head closure protein n=1 Tax=Sulfuriferula sp. TaxID=2025307 RepID=UPI002731DBF5|nr:phage head closure protein [Sulfuriferula sp.]MDP2026445.1 phage head closure protein [Sulfuriferula sp.]
MARIGDFRRLVTLQARSSTQDSYGSQLATWYDVATLWANMNPLIGRELLAAQALYTEVTSEITVRYSAIFATPKAVAAMRISYAGRLFDILGMVNQEERNHLVSLFCKEGLSDG